LTNSDVYINMFLDMTMNTVTVTDLQRHPKRILDSLDKPVVVMRDSRPKAVIVDYQEYQRMRDFEDDKLGREFEGLLGQMQARNRGVDEKKVDELIKEALHAAGRD